MTAPVLTFFNNTAGVGKTSLIYRLAWMFAAMDKRVLIADFDPQARLTATCLDEQRIEAMCTNDDPGATTVPQPASHSGRTPPADFQTHLRRRRHWQPRRRRSGRQKRFQATRRQNRDTDGDRRPTPMNDQRRDALPPGALLLGPGAWQWLSPLPPVNPAPVAAPVLCRRRL